MSGVGEEEIGLGDTANLWVGDYEGFHDRPIRSQSVNFG